jgi:glyoxylase-like metal-dependent hydrolase (beta-lactamase superfamily II)
MRYLFASLLAIAPSPALAQATPPPPPPPMTVEQVAPGFTFLHGRGGNMLVFHGPEGSLLVDDDFARDAERVAATVATLGPGPVRYVVNSHWHGDHTGANALLASRGAVTIGHRNVRARMAAEQRIRGRAIPPEPEAMRPLLTYEGDLTLQFNNEALRILHPARAHTDSDSIVYFPRANVLAMGDIFFNRFLPFLDVAGGGSIDGLIAAVNFALALADDRTIIIPGHGAVAHKADLIAYRDMLVRLRTEISAAMRQHHTLDQIKQARLADRYVTGLGWITPDELVEAIYTSLASQAPTRPTGARRRTPARRSCRHA